MNKADQDSMNSLHGELAKVLTVALKNGVMEIDKETGETQVASCPASILSVARQFLKDNNIEADLRKNKPLRELAAVLPFAGAQEA